MRATTCCSQLSTTSPPGAFRRRGVGRSLVVALGDLAVERGCRQMWVPIELDNEAAVATYLSAGAGPPEPASTMSWEFEE